MTYVDRRTLLYSGGSLAVLFALGGCESLKEAIQNRPRRRDISTLSNTHPIVQAYRDAVAQMKALPNSDPRNWTRQAEIHQNFCPHGNWFFLPWHRAYLLSFERICQSLLGDADFGLPYWNWSCSRKIPAPFWVGGSSLFHSPRTATSSSEASETIVGGDAMDAILNETDFELFASGKAKRLRPILADGPDFQGSTGALENPHNYIHGFVGGTMGSYMSPLDPVFWTHHNVIDYFWFEWNQRGNANTNDPLYTNFDITGQMVDGAGNPVTYRVDSMILAPLLSYQFVPPGPCGLLNFQLVERAWLREFLERGAAIRFEPNTEFEPQRDLRLAVGQPLRARLTIPREAAAMESVDSESRLLLRLDDVAPPADEDFYVQVYVDLGEDEAANPRSPSYAGSFAFFTDPSSHHTTRNYYVSLDSALQKLRAAGRATGEAPVVTLVAVPIEEGREVRNPNLTIGALQPVTIPRRAIPEVDDEGVRIKERRVQ